MSLPPSDGPLFDWSEDVPVNEDVEVRPATNYYARKQKTTEDWRRPKLKHQRYYLALVLLILVGILAAGSLVLAIVLDTNAFERVREVIPIVFGPLVTLLGTSFAWYYASSGNDRQGKDK